MIQSNCSRLSRCLMHGPEIILMRITQTIETLTTWTLPRQITYAGDIFESVTPLDVICFFPNGWLHWLLMWLFWSSERKRCPPIMQYTNLNQNPSSTSKALSWGIEFWPSRWKPCTLVPSRFSDLDLCHWICNTFGN